MARSVSPVRDPLVFSFETDEYRSIPIPGIKHAKMGTCFIKVTDLPAGLERFMDVNPRVPKRSKDTLTGPVVAGILKTLRESPEDMALKNQGIYLLVENAEFEKLTGGKGKLTLHFTDPDIHGIVNGGHTFAAIREAIESDNTTADELDQVDRAFVRLHLMQGLPKDKVSDIAEGLNKNKPVDNPSLLNLQGLFDDIKRVMKGHPGEDVISYHQGDEGNIYVTDILTFMELFNAGEFTRTKHPYTLYRNKATTLKLFEQHVTATPSPLASIVPHLRDILELSDGIRAMTPTTAKQLGFEFGRMKPGRTNERTGSQKNRGIKLPFTGQTVDYRVPNGWVLPMLAAFRANVRWNKDGKAFEWIVPLNDLLPHVIRDLVGVCISQHKAGLPPEEVAARESSFSQCYDKVLLRLALLGKVSVDAIN